MRALDRGRGFALWMMLGLLLLSCRVASAQQYGWISGTIMGDNGRPVPSVLVTVLGTGRSALSDADGRFAVTTVPAGPQRIEIKAEGREPIVLPVPVHSGENTIGTLTLQPEMPVERSDPGFPLWKRIGANRAVAYRFGDDCGVAAVDSLSAPTVERVDSTIAAGRITLSIDREDPSRLSFAFAPKGPPGNLSMVVYNAAGRPVRRLRSGAAPHPSVLSWDGRDDSGRPVPPGSYRARFSTGRDQVELKFCRREIGMPDSAIAR